jgi:hypothetical protein
MVKALITNKFPTVMKLVELQFQSQNSETIKVSSDYQKMLL